MLAYQVFQVIAEVHVVAKKLTQNQFIEISKLKHGNKYDYSRSIYKTARDKVEIICGEHGSFFQSAHHHMAGISCKKCSDKNKGESSRLDIFDVMSRFHDKHGKKYDYSLFKYKTCKDKSKIICPIHGVFNQSPSDHFVSGCNSCGNESNSHIKNQTFFKERFIEKAIKKHGNRYDYSKVFYKGSHVNTTIICKIHGEFKQTPTTHLSKGGCRHCGYKSAIRLKKKKDLFYGYSKTKYVDMANNKHNGKANLYIVKASSKSGEVFYKVGISMYSVKHRYASHFPYEIDSYVEKSFNADEAWELEKSIHKTLKRWAYTPKKTFPGYTECFSHIPNDIYNLVVCEYD